MFRLVLLLLSLCFVAAAAVVASARNFSNFSEGIFSVRGKTEI